MYTLASICERRKIIICSYNFKQITTFQYIRQILVSILPANSGTKKQQSNHNNYQVQMKNRIKSKATAISPKAKIVDYNHVYPLLNNSRPPLPNSKNCNTKNKQNQFKSDLYSKCSYSSKQTLSHSKHSSTHSYKMSHQEYNKMDVPAVNFPASRKSVNSNARNCINSHSINIVNAQKTQAMTKLDKVLLQQTRQIMNFYYHIRDVYQINQGLGLMSIYFNKKSQKKRNKYRNKLRDSESFEQLYQDSRIDEYNQRKAQLDLDVQYVHSQDLGQIIDEQAQASEVQQRILVRSSFLKGQQQKYGSMSDTQLLNQQYQNKNRLVQFTAKQQRQSYTLQTEQFQKQQQLEQKYNQPMITIEKLDDESDTKKITKVRKGLIQKDLHDISNVQSANIKQRSFFTTQKSLKVCSVSGQNDQYLINQQNSMSASLSSQNFTEKQQFSQQNSFDRKQEGQTGEQKTQFISFEHLSQNSDFQGPQILATFGGSQQSYINNTYNKNKTNNQSQNANGIYCKNEKVRLDLYLEIEPQNNYDQTKGNQNVNTMNMRAKGAFMNSSKNASGLSYAHKIEQQIKVALSNPSGNDRGRGSISGKMKNTKFVCVPKENRKQVVIQRISLEPKTKHSTQRQKQLTTDKSYLEKVIRKAGN